MGSIRTKGHTVLDTRLEVHGIGFVTRSRNVRLAGSSTAQLGLDVLCVELHTRRASIDDCSDLGEDKGVSR